MPTLSIARITQVHLADVSSRIARPLYASRISAGFASPAEEYIEAHLDLNKLVVDNPEATFFLSVQGNSMTGAGILDGDTLVIDRSLEPVDGKVVVAAVDGDLLVKRLRFKNNQPYLVAEHPNYPAMPITTAQEFTIWGVVTWSFHPHE